MTLQQRIDAFEKVGSFIKEHYTETPEKDKALHEGLERVIELAHQHNNWFIPKFVNHAISSIGNYLNLEQLSQFCKNLGKINERTVAIVCAGNIPMVGWHDIMTVLLSGHRALIRLSSDDNILLPFFLKLLTHYEPAFEEKISFASGKLTAFDAVIATGSNNTATHFRYYFSKYPHIIRANRTSVAVLTGKESDRELASLGDDIFTYFGLGCRNVSKLLVPADYNFDRFFKQLLPHGEVINNKKYGNNYDYHRAIYLLEKQPFLDNNFVMLKESSELHSPVAVLYYQRFGSENEMRQYISQNENQLQCVVGSDFTPFGYSQQPVITEFADKIDTLAFLVNL